MTAPQQQLLTMAMWLLVTMMASGALAAWFLRHIFSWALILGSFVISIILIFVAVAVAQSGNVPVIFFVASLFGASVGSDIGGFALLLGHERGLSPETTFKGVGIALGITTIVTVFAGIVGIYSGINFQGMGMWLFAGLWVLIGLSVAGMIGWVSARAEYAIGIVAAMFWGLYMIYNFNKVVDKFSEPSWPAAMEVAMGLYLDIVNFLIRILPYVLDALD